MELLSDGHHMGATTGNVVASAASKSLYGKDLWVVSSAAEHRSYSSHQPQLAIGDHSAVSSIFSRLRDPHKIAVNRNTLNTILILVGNWCNADQRWERRESPVDLID
jgi:hypothetical protein